MGICEILTIIFVVAKLFGVLQWSWWLCLLPEIIACTIYVILFIISVGGAKAANEHVKKIWGEWDDWKD